jgi:hypothetical protein
VTPVGTSVRSVTPVVGFRVTRAPAVVTPTMTGGVAAAGLAEATPDALAGFDGGALEAEFPRCEHADSTAAAVTAATPKPTRPIGTIRHLLTAAHQSRGAQHLRRNG